jgi:hypothetical protein
MLLKGFNFITPTEIMLLLGRRMNRNALRNGEGEKRNAGRNTVKPVLNGNIFRYRDYHSIS